MKRKKIEEMIFTRKRSKKQRKEHCAERIQIKTFTALKVTSCRQTLGFGDYLALFMNQISKSSFGN